MIKVSYINKDEEVKIFFCDKIITENGNFTARAYNNHASGLEHTVFVGELSRINMITHITKEEYQVSRAEGQGD